MLAGFWAIDEKPTGSKDPFALRRAALGVIRLVLENKLDLKLRSILESHRFYIALSFESDASRIMKKYMDLTRPLVGLMNPDERSDQLNAIRQAAQKAEAKLVLSEKFDDAIRFFTDRLKVYLRDKGVRHDVIDACFRLGGQDDLVLLVARVEALQAFLATPDGANLLAGYKRAVNILTAEEKKDGVEYSLDPNPKFVEHDAEKALFVALDEAEPALDRALGAEDFRGAMAALAALRAPIDGFFEGVMVNAENQIVRRNRLCLMHRIRSVMGRVAAFGAVEG
jgi:glycyl-tRNA synthetase beta chain